MTNNKELRKFVGRKKFFPIACGVPQNLTPEQHRTLLKFFGIEVIGEVEGTFFEIKLPPKWKFHVPPKSENWAYLYDHNDKPRCTIFYKVIEKNKTQIKVTTFANYMTRYRIKIDREVPRKPFDKQDEKYLNSGLLGQVLDGDVEIYRTNTVPQVEKIGTPEHFTEEKLIREELWQDCHDYISKIKPEYDNISKYWE